MDPHNRIHSGSGSRRENVKEKTEKVHDIIIGSNFILKNYVILNNLHCFFVFFSILFCLFQLQKIYQKLFCFKFVQAGSGFALKKQLDPDPQKKYVDPQACS